MKAIITKSRPNSRIKVQAEGVPHIVVHCEDTDKEENHRQAALKLCEKYSWGTNLVSGGLPTPGQWVHCFVPREEKKGKVLIDLDPVWDETEGCWTVTESDERGNALEVHLFKTFDECVAFIEGWCRCGEVDAGVPVAEQIEGLLNDLQAEKDRADDLERQLNRALH